MRSPPATHWSSWRRIKLPSRCRRSKRGVLARQVKHDGDVVAVDDVLGEIDEAASGTRGTRWRSCARSDNARSGAPSTTAGEPPAAASAIAPSRHRPRRGALRPKAASTSPRVTGTGRGGVVSKPDVIEQADSRCDGRRSRRAETEHPRPRGAPARRSLRGQRRSSASRQSLRRPRARARRARRCRRVESASPNISSKRNTRRHISRRSTRSTCRR